jgi:hypothetical protein
MARNFLCCVLIYFDFEENLSDEFIYGWGSVMMDR